MYHILFLSLFVGIVSALPTYPGKSSYSATATPEIKPDEKEDTPSTAPPADMKYTAPKAEKNMYAPPAVKVEKEYAPEMKENEKPKTPETPKSDTTPSLSTETTYARRTKRNAFIVQVGGLPGSGALGFGLPFPFPFLGPLGFGGPGPLAGIAADIIHGPIRFWF